MVVILSIQNDKDAIIKIVMEMVNMEYGLKIFDSLKMKKKRKIEPYNVYDNKQFINKNYYNLIHDLNSSLKIQNELKKIKEKYNLEKYEKKEKIYNIKSKFVMQYSVSNNSKFEKKEKWTYNHEKYSLLSVDNNEKLNTISPFLLIIDTHGRYNFNYYKNLNFPFDKYKMNIINKTIIISSSFGINYHIYNETNTNNLLINQKIYYQRITEIKKLIDFKDVKFVRLNQFDKTKNLMIKKDFDFDKQEEKEKFDCKNGKPEFPYNRCYLTNALLYDLVYVLEIEFNNNKYHLLLSPILVEYNYIAFNNMLKYRLKNIKFTLKITHLPISFKDAIASLNLDKNLEMLYNELYYNKIYVKYSGNIHVGEFIGYCKNLPYHINDFNKKMFIYTYVT